MTDASSTPSSSSPTPTLPAPPSSPTPVAIDPAKLNAALDAGIQRAADLSGEEAQYQNLVSVEQKIVALLEGLGVSIS